MDGQVGHVPRADSERTSQVYIGNPGCFRPHRLLPNEEHAQALVAMLGKSHHLQGDRRIALHLRKAV